MQCFLTTELRLALRQYPTERKVSLTEIQNSNYNGSRLRAVMADKKDWAKIIFANAVEALDDSTLVGNLAEILERNGIEIGQNRLLMWFRDNGYLSGSMDESWNTPTQKSLDAGLFTKEVHTSSSPEWLCRTEITIKLTGKGLIFFTDLFLTGGAKIE